MFELKDRNILIVGASSGIGEKTAFVLSELGANVILTARREELLKQICEKIPSGKASYYGADISEIEKTAALVKTIVAEQGRLDGMVYAAGSSGDIPLSSLNYERMLKVFDTNYFGFIECVRQVCRKGNYKEGMRIAAVSSIASMLGEKAHTSYAAAKAAMDASIRCIAKELGSKGICINSVAPGAIRTRMYDDFVRMNGENSKAVTQSLQRQYLGIGETEDVAYAIAFLLSPRARFLTGITLPVDGGFASSR